MQFDIIHLTDFPEGGEPMLTIQLSPQLHHAVKWAKMHVTDALTDIQSISSRISSSESKVLVSTLKNSKGKVKREELNSYWN
jgi:hypothetical protein